MRRSQEEVAVDLERRALIARAKVEANKRPEVAVLFRCVRDIDRVCEEDEGAATDPKGKALLAARAALVDALFTLGVEVL